MVNKGGSLAVDENGRLDEATRRGLADKVLERLDAPVRVEGKQSTLRSVLQKQARHLAVFLRGEAGAYCPYVAAW